MTRHKAVVLSSVLLSLGTLAVATPAVGDTGHEPPASAPVSRASASASAQYEERVVTAVERGAHTLQGTDPEGGLRDLRALGRMVRDSQVVGLGEATHGSRDFFRMKHRVFRYLVEEKGFRSFSLELPWSSGVRLNEYVLGGKGELRDIAREEFQGSYRIWNNQDYLDLVEWMRGYNLRHPDDPVQFMGDDMGYAGPELYERVTAYVARRYPRLLDRVTELYRGLAPATDAGTYGEEYFELPLAEREERAERTGKVYDLLRAQRPAPGTDEQEHGWTVQHARAIHQMARGMAFDFADEDQVAAMMKLRDQVMAENVAWWHRHTGDRILLSAHNTHVSYDSFDARYPKTQGAFLRDALGKDYVSIGFSFYKGAFKAFGTEDNVMRTYRVGAAKPGSNEHTLDKAHQDDYILDLRTAPQPARAWLDQERGTWNIGAGWPDPTKYTTALGRAHDILVHLHDVEATTYLGAP
ncbi:erythromycin esterase-like protein [Streptomyces sp. SAI-117]|uniref:erythromycin esterase family protein n=1 Tax=Streptomyces sp. SAI-117 TaxID=2940546 RepID=UPI0024750FD7|nr:erythromycin esterase family protein [Streptomyces sp. SAI-117]MDH6565708.1 erythromycin esterase-like protein [Streptomyces sp. SAI-117]